MGIKASSVTEFLEVIVRAGTSVSSCDTHADEGEIHLYYRGQTNSAWNITPSVFREKKDGSGIGGSSSTHNACREEQSAFSHAHGCKQRGKYDEKNIYAKALMECPHDFPDRNSHCAVLSTMQHFGLPTRLIDVTSNALMALYFAVVDSDGRTSDSHDGKVFVIAAPDSHIKEYDSDAVAILSSLARLNCKEKDALKKYAEKINDNRDERDEDNERDPHRAVMDFNDLQNYDKHHSRFETKDAALAYRHLLHEIKKERPQFEHVIDPFDLLSNFIFTPQKTFQRIIRQDGSFIIFGLGDEKLPIDNFTSRNIKRPTVIKTIDICREAKEKIRDELKYCGITQVHVYPELEKLGESIRLGLEE